MDSRIKTLLGALVSCAALTHADTQTLDISTTLHEMEPLLRQEAAKPQKEFQMNVRNRRRKWGKPLKREDKILPFAPVAPVDQPEPSIIDTQPEDELGQFDWLIANAERRIQEAELALEAAQTVGLFDRNHNQHTPSEVDLEHLISQIDLERKEQTKLLRRQTQLLVEQGTASAEQERVYRGTLRQEAQTRYQAAEAEMQRLQTHYDLMAGDGEHWRERFKILDQLEAAIQIWIQTGIIASEF